MRRALAVLAVVLVAGAVGTWAQVSPSFDRVPKQATAAPPPCRKADALPTSGRLQLEFVKPSSALDPDKNDYHLVATFRWDSQRALDCFQTSADGWAYEHRITYGARFHRKIWNEDFSSLTGGVGPYLDSTTADGEGETSLGFGIFRPERLHAGFEYTVELDLFLPNSPGGGMQPLMLEGEVIETQCADGGPWCVGQAISDAAHDRETFIGETGFAVTGDCYTWARGRAPTPCSPRSATAGTRTTPVADTQRGSEPSWD